MTGQSAILALPFCLFLSDHRVCYCYCYCSGVFAVLWNELREETTEMGQVHAAFAAKLSSDLENTANNYLHSDHQWQQLSTVGSSLRLSFSLPSLSSS